MRQVALVMSESLQPHELQPTRFLCPWDSRGQNTGVGCEIFSPGLFLTQESLMAPALAGRFLSTSATWEACAWPDSCSLPLSQLRKLSKVKVKLLAQGHQLVSG